MQLGAYAIERDYSHYVAYAAKTVLAVVGTATKGPVGVPTVCSSSQDLVSKFGSLKTDCYGLYAGQYFLSQSSRLYYVRAASDSAKNSKATIAGLNSGDTSVSDAITIEAINPGTYADGYQMIVANASDKYTLTLKSASGTILETIKNVDMDSLVVGYQSDYFKISAVNSTAASLTEGTYTFSGGDDGISDISDEHYIAALNTLAADKLDMNLLSVPGVSTIPVINAALALAEARGDTLFLVDPPAGLTRDGVIQWHNGGGAHEHEMIDSSYGALYYDWVNIYDSMNRINVTVPPSVVVAASYAYSARVSDLWYAPAGLQRGIVRGVLTPVTKLSKSDVDVLYTEENNINSLYEDPQVGLVLWGQKTLLREDTALNRVNVRRLLNYLKRVISAACNYLTFEPNDRITWNSFELKIDPILKDIKSKRGIYDYRIFKGDTIMIDRDIDNYRMPCKIMIRPTKAAEEIPIYFVITSTGADFNEVLDESSISSDL